MSKGGMQFSDEWWESVNRISVLVSWNKFFVYFLINFSKWRDPESAELWKKPHQKWPKIKETRLVHFSGRILINRLHHYYVVIVIWYVHTLLVYRYSKVTWKPKLISSLIVIHTCNWFQSPWNQCNDGVGRKIEDVFNTPKGTVIAEGTLPKDLLLEVRPM